MPLSFVRIGFISCYLIVLSGGVINAADVSLDPTGHGTGLRPPTAQEQAWLDDHAIVVERVYPNALALSRLHGERQRRGLAAGPALTVAETGAEFTGSTRTGSHQATARLVADRRRAANDLAPVAPLEAGALVAVALPAAVDNSAEKWFPPIGNQGGLGSCYTYSVGYYMLSFQIARDLDRDLRDATAPDHYSKIFSPRFLFNMSNSSGDNGSVPWPTLKDIGCPTWASVPYTDATDNLSCGRLPVTAAVWREAIPARITGLRIPSDFKQELANGNLISFCNAINSWQYRTVGANSDTRVRSVFAGESIAIGQSDGPVNHAMTLVGYDDGVWVDLNSDGAVQTGELGAYKIANQWGTGWGNRGFRWISYSASYLMGNPFILSTNGLPAPAAVAEVTVVTGKRSEFKPRFAVGTASSQNPTVFRSSEWEFRTPGRSGGLIPFDGGTVSSAATLAFDVTDLTVPGTLQRFFLLAEDTTYGNPLTITRFQITDAAGNVLAPLTGTAPAGGLPRSADASRVSVWADVTTASASGAVPVITAPTQVTGTVGQIQSFTVSATNAPLHYAWSDLPPGLTGSNDLVIGTPDTSGTFRATLLASNQYGASSATVDFTIAASGVPVPVITSPGSVNLTIGALPSPIYEITATNTTGYTTYGCSGLAPGLLCSGSSIYFFGVDLNPGTYQGVVYAVNAGGRGSRALTMTISRPNNGGIPAFSSPLSLNGNISQALSYQIVASNAPTSYAANGLPAGVAINTATGLISGIPTTAGISSVTLSATNGSGTAQVAMVITIGSAEGTSTEPVITTQPAPMTKRVGLTATFTAAVSGTPTPTIQWQRSPNGSSTWTAISGATATTYTTATLTLGDNGARFRAVASNSAGSATSTAATLTVRRRGDVNMDGAVDISDLILVKQAFGGTAATSDLNGDGAVDISDLILVKQEFGL